MGAVSRSASAEETVRALIAAARLSPDDEEMAELIRVYPMFRAALDELYAVSEARYASPALVFSAAATYVEWSHPDASATTATGLTDEGAPA